MESMAVEAQLKGLFTAIGRARAEMDSPALAVLDDSTVRHRVVAIDLGQLQRARAVAASRQRDHTCRVSSRAVRLSFTAA